MPRAALRGARLAVLPPPLHAIMWTRTHGTFAMPRKTTDTTRKRPVVDAASPDLGPIEGFLVRLLHDMGHGREQDWIDRYIAPAIAELPDLKSFNRQANPPEALDALLRALEFDPSKDQLLSVLAAGNPDCWGSAGEKNRPRLMDLPPGSDKQELKQRVARDIPGDLLADRISLKDSREQAERENLRRLIEAKKAGVPEDQSAKPEGMQISEEQREAARGGKYIQPSRVGTRTIAGHFDADVAERLKDLARARRTTVQALLSEALGDLFEKHGADLERYEVAIRALRKD